MTLLLITLIVFFAIWGWQKISKRADEYDRKQATKVDLELQEKLRLEYRKEIAEYYDKKYDEPNTYKIILDLFEKFGVTTLDSISEDITKHNNKIEYEKRYSELVEENRENIRLNTYYCIRNAQYKQNNDLMSLLVKNKDYTLTKREKCEYYDFLKHREIRLPPNEIIITREGYKKIEKILNKTTTEDQNNAYKEYISFISNFKNIKNIFINNGESPDIAYISHNYYKKKINPTEKDRDKYFITDEIQTLDCISLQNKYAECDDRFVTVDESFNFLKLPILPFDPPPELFRINHTLKDRIDESKDDKWYHAVSYDGSFEDVSDYEDMEEESIIGDIHAFDISALTLSLFQKTMKKRLYEHGVYAFSQDFKTESKWQEEFKKKKQVEENRIKYPWL